MILTKKHKKTRHCLLTTKVRQSWKYEACISACEEQIIIKKKKFCLVFYKGSFVNYVGMLGVVTWLTKC